MSYGLIVVFLMALTAATPILSYKFAFFVDSVLVQDSGPTYYLIIPLAFLTAGTIFYFAHKYLKAPVLKLVSKVHPDI